VHCRHLIDLNGVAELAGIDEEDGRLVFGAMTRQRRMMESDKVRRFCPIAKEALRLIGHIATRTRGTFGGSLCNMDPAAELGGVAALHDAVLRVRSAHGAREIAIADWPRSYMTPALAPDELLCGISLRAWPPGHGHAFLEFSKRHHDYAVVAAGALMTVDDSGRIERVAIVVLGVGVAAARLTQAEEMLVGQRGESRLFDEAAQTAESISPLPDDFANQGYPRRHVSAAFRCHLGVVLARRVLYLAWSRATHPEERFGHAAA
jgi:carbon-monoxide dehydrogenase medium subunit